MSLVYYFHYHPDQSGSKKIEHYSLSPHPYDYAGTGYFSDVIYHSRNTAARFYIVTFGYEQGWPNKHCPPRTIDRYTLHFVFKGSGEWNGKHVHAGQIFIVQSNKEYTFTHSEKNPMTLGWIGISGKELELMIETLHLPKDPIINITPNQIEEIEKIFIDTVYNSHPNVDIPYFLFSRFFNILSLSGVSYTSDLSTSSLYTHEAMKYINTHYMENITVTDVAKAAHVSESYLRALYLQELGISPRVAIMQKRIATAKALLKQNHIPISTIAESCGYVDQSAFAKRFKQETSMSPIEYRKKHQNHD